MPTLTKENIKERIIIDENGCWIWTKASKSDKGRSLKYGWVAFNGTQLNAHKASWIIHYGDVPNGLFVCHKCDVPLCVNPEHLFLGTASDNMKDMWSKGRHKNPSDGVIGSYSAKLSLDDVRKIRQLIKDGIKQSEIAKMFFITQSNVSCINTGKLWSRYV